MSQIQIQPAVTTTFDDKWNEQILVVKRDRLFPDFQAVWHGVQSANLSKCIDTIITYQEFMPRGIAETDFSYKQVIPYLVFKHGEKLFLMQRRSNSSESRLANKYSLGIGGHIRKEDIQSRDIFEWARREFYEEVDYKDILKITPLGILNDDTNDVGKVHVGLVLLLEGDSDQISIRSELQNGTLYSFEECMNFYPQMESWSQLVFDFLTTSKR